MIAKFKDILKEVSKIKFPSQKEFFQSLGILIAFVIISGLFLMLIDYLVSFVALLF